MSIAAHFYNEHEFQCEMTQSQRNFQRNEVIK